MTLIGEKINVMAVFKNGFIMPRVFEWNGRKLKVNRVVLNYSKKLGEGLVRFFSVEVLGSTSVYQISFNTEDMLWKLEGVEDDYNAC